MKAFFTYSRIKKFYAVKFASKNRWCIRTMFITCNLANKAVNMNLIRSGNHAHVYKKML